MSIFDLEKAKEENYQILVKQIKDNYQDHDFNLSQLLKKFLVVPKEDKVTKNYDFKELSIQGIRSFGEEQNINFSSGLTLIYAPNGTGKTSFVDALELLSEGETSRKKSHNTESEVKDKNYIPHKLADGRKSDIQPRVSLKVRNHSDENDVLYTWADFSEHRFSEAPDINIIARRNMRNVITDKPSDRLKLLSGPLGISDWLGQWSYFSNEIYNEHEKLPQDSSELLNVSNYLLEQDLEFDIIDIQHIHEKIRQWIASKPINDNELKIPSYLGNWESNFPALMHDLEILVGKKPQYNHESQREKYLDFIEKFLEISHEGMPCPGCGKVDLEQSRIDELKSLIEKEKEYSQWSSDYKQLVSNIHREINRLISCNDIVNFGNLSSAESEVTSSIISVANKINEGYEKFLDYKDDPELTLEKLQKITDILLSQEKYFNKLTQLLDDYKVQRDNFSHLSVVEKGYIKFIKDNDLSVSQSIYNIFQLDKLREIFLKASREIDQKIQKEVNDRIISFSDSINQWMENLAPANTPAVKINVKGISGRSAAQLQFMVDLPGSTNTHAIGYLSDAQMDMLSLAIYFSRIQAENPGSLIVLDDPSDMLDGSTRKIFVDKGIGTFFQDPSSHNQIVILTHDDALVKDLWDFSKNNNVNIFQYNMETISSQVISGKVYKEDRHTVFVPRNFKGALLRMENFLAENPCNDNNKYRLWYRAAFASQVRVALEMYVKQLSQIISSEGARIINEPSNQSAEIQRLCNQINQSLNELKAEVCGHGAHIPQKKKIDNLSDLLSGQFNAYLNPGSHADVILPDSNVSKLIFEELRKLSKDIDFDDSIDIGNELLKNKIGIFLYEMKQCKEGDCKYSSSS